MQTEAQTEDRKLPPNFKIPSKSKCVKMLRKVFGDPRVRFAQFGLHGLAVIAYVGNSEFHAVEIEPKTEEARANVHWYATVAAFNAAGYRVEVHPDRIELVVDASGEPARPEPEVKAEIVEQPEITNEQRTEAAEAKTV